MKSIWTVKILGFFTWPGNEPGISRFEARLGVCGIFGTPMMGSCYYGKLLNMKPLQVV